MKNWINKHPRICVIVIMTIFCSFLFLSPWRLSIVRFNSVKYRVVVWEEISPLYQVHTDEYLLVKWADENVGYVGLHKGDFLIKRVGCRPKQTLEYREGKQFYCDGRFIGETFETLPDGTAVSTFQIPGDHTVVPDGQLFLVGDTIMSYDSKYLGYIPRDLIVGRVLFGI